MSLNRRFERPATLSQALIERERSAAQAHRYAPIAVVCGARFNGTIQGGNSNVYTDSYLIRDCARMFRAQLHRVFDYRDCSWVRVVRALRSSRRQLAPSDETTGERQVRLRTA